jgi:hypothetical protein
MIKRVRYENEKTLGLSFFSLIGFKQAEGSSDGDAAGTSGSCASTERS